MKMVQAGIQDVRPVAAVEPPGTALYELSAVSIEDEMTRLRGQAGKLQEKFHAGVQEMKGRIVVMKRGLETLQSDLAAIPAPSSASHVTVLPQPDATPLPAVFHASAALLTQLSSTSASARVTQAACVQHAVIFKHDHKGEGVLGFYTIPSEVTKVVVYGDALTVTRTDTRTGESVVEKMSKSAHGGCVYLNPVWESPNHSTTLSGTTSSTGVEMVFETVLVARGVSQIERHTEQRADALELDVDALMFAAYKSPGPFPGVIRSVLRPSLTNTSVEYVLGKQAEVSAPMQTVDTVVWSRRLTSFMLVVNGDKHVHVTPAVVKAVKAGHFGVKREDGRFEIRTGVLNFSKLTSVVVDVVPSDYVQFAF
jgi:hypothetical protein